TELAQYPVRYVDRILGHEIDADTLRADQPDDLFDLVHQRLGRVVKQEMRLVEEEDEFWFRRVADLGQLLEQLGQHPEQEGRIQPRALHQLVGNENVDHAPAVTIGTHEILQRKRRFAEKSCPTLVFQHQQLALNGSNRRPRDITEALCCL